MRELIKVADKRASAIGRADVDFELEAQPLDRNSPLPLWAQLESELRRRLNAGHFTQRFPTDRELTGIYEVSRHTARHAVAQLGADGIVRRERGVGTRIDAGQLEQSLGALYSLFESVRAQGLTQESRLLRSAEVHDAEANAELGRDPADRLVLIERLRLAGDAPLAIDRAWLTPEIGEPLMAADLSNTGLYDEMERVAGSRPNQGWERIVPILPAESERKLLGLTKREAAFSLQRLGCINDTPVEWRVTIIRGDRFTFRAEWSSGRGAGLRLQPR